MVRREILHIIDSLGTGGAERLLVEIITCTPYYSHHVISLSNKLDLSEQLPKQVPLISLGFTGKKDTFSAIRKIRRYILSRNIDIVHSHLAMANVLARVATPRGKVLFNSLHSQNGIRLFRNPWSIASIVERWTYSKRHRLIAVSQAVLNDYQKYIGVKGASFVLYNFVADKFFAPNPHSFNHEQGLRMISVGTLKPAKNYSFLVEAFKGLPEDCVLDIYGDGPLKESLQREIMDAKVNIRLCGGRTDIEKLYQSYDLFVMSSIVEGHPVALVEAMAAGMPALLSDIPVLHETTGGKGLFFALDDPADFRQKVLGILSGSILLNGYASHNHQLASNTARKQQYLLKLDSIYEDALKGRLKDANH